MTRLMLLSVALTVTLAQAAVATPIVATSGFETPILGSGSNPSWVWYTSPQSDPGVSVPGWTFASSAGGLPNGTYDGLCRPDVDGAGFTALSGYEGNQVAFVSVLGTFSQTITNFNAGTFTVSFLAGGRYYAGTDYGNNPIEVKLDTTVLTFGVNRDETVAPVTGVMNTYTSNAITIGSGPHILTFSGTAHGDNTTLIDSVHIAGTSTIPEPSLFILVVTGLIGLLAYAWRKRK